MSQAIKVSHHETHHEALLTDKDVADFLQIGVGHGVVTDNVSKVYNAKKLAQDATFVVEIAIVPEDSQTAQ